MRLYRKIFRQFIFVMQVITMANNRRFASFCYHESMASMRVCMGFLARFPGSRSMAMVMLHRKVRIVVLEVHETIAACCKPGDIAIVAAADGWWTSFIDRDGAVHGYDRPYVSYLEALWAAKAAAEYGAA